MGRVCGGRKPKRKESTKDRHRQIMLSPACPLGGGGRRAPRPGSRVGKPAPNAVNLRLRAGTPPQALPGPGGGAPGARAAWPHGPPTLFPTMLGPPEGLDFFAPIAECFVSPHRGCQRCWRKHLASGLRAPLVRPPTKPKRTPAALFLFIVCFGFFFWGPHPAPPVPLPISVPKNAQGTKKHFASATRGKANTHGTAQNKTVILYSTPRRPRAACAAPRQ